MRLPSCPRAAFCSHLLEARLRLWVWVWGGAWAPQASDLLRGATSVPWWDPRLRASPCPQPLVPLQGRCCGHTARGEEGAGLSLSGGGEQRPGPTAMDPEMGVTTSLFPTRNPAETFTTLLPVRNVVRFIRRHPLCFVLLPEYSHPQSPSEALGTKDDPQRATGSSDSLLILPLY